MVDRSTFSDRDPFAKDRNTSSYSYSYSTNTQPITEEKVHTTTISPRPEYRTTSYHEERTTGPIHTYTEYDSRNPDRCKLFENRPPLKSNTETHSWKTNTSGPTFSTKVTTFESGPHTYSRTYGEPMPSDFGLNKPIGLDMPTSRLISPNGGTTTSVNTKQSVKSSSNGNVAVVETAPDGKFVVLENTHGLRNEDIGGWKLKQFVDGRLHVVYTFPKATTVRPYARLKIWSCKEGSVNAHIGELICDDVDLFGVGQTVRTVLYDLKMEEKAEHTAKNTNS